MVFINAPSIRKIVFLSIHLGRQWTLGLRRSEAAPEQSESLYGKGNAASTYGTEMGTFGLMRIIFIVK